MTQKFLKGPMFSWVTLKSVTATILFIAISALIEYFIVMYAVSLGVEDENLLKWSFQLPGTSWTMTVVISTLFHLVPICVIVALTFSWICLTKYVALKTPRAIEEKFKRLERGKRQDLKGKRKLTSKISRGMANFLGKVKSALLRVKGIAYLSAKLSLAKATVKSALTILPAFSALILLFSLLAYPRLIYHAFLGLYQNSPSALNFALSMGNAAKGLAETLAPIGWGCAAINNAITAAAPTLRAIAANFGSLIKPLADLPPVCKYLVFQNFAAWISALAVFFHGLYGRKGYRYRRGKRV